MLVKKWTALPFLRVFFLSILMIPCGINNRQTLVVCLPSTPFATFQCVLMRIDSQQNEFMQVEESVDFFSLSTRIQSHLSKEYSFIHQTQAYSERVKSMKRRTHTYKAKCHLTLLLFSLLLCVSRNFLASEFSNAWHRHRPHIPCELRHEHSHWYSSPCFIVDHA